MALFEEIPECFYALFRSVNRNTYIEALLRINEEYEYNNYFLSRQACIQVLNDYFLKKSIWLQPEEEEGEPDETEESNGVRILSWLLKHAWLKKTEDYASLTSNIVIPDYASIFIDAFLRLQEEEPDETNIYIQNVYAILFSVKNDPRADVGLLKTAVVNTKKLNHALQDLLHNMDKFFGSLLEKKNYAELLKEHLDGYVETIVRKKYHILKTSDNFYQYKTDIRRWLGEMEEDTAWLQRMSRASEGMYSEEDIVDMLTQIERGFLDIEHRITNMDREHTRYVHATVTRLNYLLNGEDSMHGIVLQILSKISMSDKKEDELEKVAGLMNLSDLGELTQDSLFKRRKRKQNFAQKLQPEETMQELSREEVLRMNRSHAKYTKREVQAFVEQKFQGDTACFSAQDIQSAEEYEKLILAYNDALKKESRYELVTDFHQTELFSVSDNGTYRVPDVIFRHRKPKEVNIQNEGEKR
ncbi:MAG: Wadjet anti-phage system protein JetA family protein [Lachnospiraceae bacterium]